MKRNLFLLILAFVGLIAQAQIPAGYYNNANGKTGDELKAALHNIIKGHSVVSYADLLDVYAYTDCDANGKIIDIYSNYHYSLNNYSSTYQKEGDGWNREHTWPQSWFKEKAGPKSDLFHVYPTDGFVNGKRANYPYGEVNSPTYTSGNGSKLGPCVTSGYNGVVFEPIDQYKGDIARGFFYMSVRYMGEDSGWSTSGMTNKSEILPWAMTMLLRWSDEDPVSEKEIARNNAIYGYQGNRNPFIDNPDYAHMIWDENWSGGSYNITCSTGVQHGSISAPTTAVKGSIVTITATPDPGYMVSSFTAYKTDNPSTTVSVSNSGTFTMPEFDVTVSATFTINDTYYNISLADVSHGSISASASSALSGTNITLTATPANGYSLYAWYVYKTGDMNTTVPVTGNTFSMPAFDVTVAASFVQGANGNYVKMTSAPTDWSGEYLIVCEGQGVAFNGTVENDWGRCSAVTITNQTIQATETINGYKVTISPNGEGYQFKFPSGNYMSWTGVKKFSESTTAVAYSIEISNGDVSISYGDNTLKYNHNSGAGGLRSYASGQTAIQLYKKTSSSTPTHSINFHPNGGTGTMSTQTVDEMVATALSPNAFNREGYEFDGWNTQADGGGTYYVDEASVTLLNDLDLYAQWDQKYSITLNQTANGTISATPTSAIEETTITLTATPDNGFELDHWTVTDSNNEVITVIDNEFEMPASNVTVSATFVNVGFIGSQYQLVTSTNQLVPGKTYLIVNTAAGKALGKTQNTNNRSAVAVSIANNVIGSLGDACELTLGGSSGEWTFYDSLYNNNAGGYLYAAGSGNTLKTKKALDDKGKWTISIDNNVATIVSNGSATQSNLRYNPNNNSPLFSCYISTSTLAKVELFVKADVFEKEIAGYTDNDGWYTIAAPFADFNPAQIAVGTYDLYAYNEAGEQEWINYRTDPTNFPVSATSGYLYAHSPNTTLHMTGTLNSDNYTETINLSYANSDDNLKGFNLLGNPTAHAITYTKSDNVSDGYYYLENSETWQYEPNNNVPMGRGFLVKANAAGQSVTLNPQSRGGQTDPYLCISIGDDKAYIKMEDGVSMPLLALNGKTPNLFLTRDGKPYIMLVRDDANSIDLNFKAPESSEYTLTVSTHLTSHLSSLTLIDRLTGTDIDLLQTPSYTFTARNDDYASRFKLVFSANDNENDNENENFAYISDGNIIVNGEGTLQVIDVLGHMLYSHEIHSDFCLPTSDFSSGVYVFHLITPEKTKVQKIAIY